jgi:acyl CoA:acetate/3-ketoacid CoA transferase
VPTVQQVTFSGRRARAHDVEVTFVTERCVIRLLQDGLTVTEVAPGIDLERDVLGRTHVPLRVSDGLREMEPRLFSPEPMGLELREREA